MTERDLLPSPKTTEEAYSLATILSKSTFVPKAFQNNPGDILVCMMWSHTLGIPVVQGLQYIAVVNGRPSMYGDGLLAVVMGSGKLEEISEKVETDKKGELFATCTVKRKGLPTPHVSVFTQSDAVVAGLWNKPGPWKQYPKRMLQMRARAYAIRNVFPDVISGISSAEEMHDVIDVESDVVDDRPSSSKPSMPRRKGSSEKRSETAALENRPSPSAADVLPQIDPAVEPEPATIHVQEDQSEICDQNVYELPSDIVNQIAECQDYQELLVCYRDLPEAMKKSPRLLELFSARKKELKGESA